MIWRNCSCDLIELDELSDPYLHYFCNMLAAIRSAKGPNLGDFVKYFEEKGYNENVPFLNVMMPLHNDRAQIKGLEFPVVILPNLCGTSVFKLKN
jgi:hypothetical protein